MKALARSVLMAAAFLCAPAFAADPCSSYKWNVAHEVHLFTTTPTEATVGTDADKAPVIATNRLYALALQPQQSVKYVASPSKPMLADGAYGGVIRFRVDEAGPHRIAIDSGFWLDVVRDGRPLQSVDFNGSRECAGPRKIVVYDLPAGDLVLQLAAATGSSARLTVTPVAATAP